jgi:hypothetical protein
MLVTKEEIKMEYRGYGEICIPKGAKTTHETAMGTDKDYNFIADFAWIPTHEDGTKQYGLISDATIYGINIPLHLLEEV